MVVSQFDFQRNETKIKEWRIPLWWLVNVVTSPLTGTPPSVWYPIIPCLDPHLCLVPHPLSGTPPHVWCPIPCLEPDPHVWNPILVWNPIPHVWNHIPCLVPHPHIWNPIPDWNPIPWLEPHPTPVPPTPPPVSPSHHLAQSALPPFGPCCPCLAPNCPLPTWFGPRLPSPAGTPTPCYPPPARTPPYQISSPKVPSTWEGNLGFSKFSDVCFDLTSRGFSLTSRNNIFHDMSKNSQNSHAATPFPSIR